MTEIFQHTIQIGRGDMDANGHMRNSAYLDAASNVRIRKSAFLTSGCRWRVPLAIE